MIKKIKHFELRSVSTYKGRDIDNNAVGNNKLTVDQIPTKCLKKSDST